MPSVLIAEDDTVTREVLFDLFCDQYTCYATGTVEDALERLNSERFDVVLADISMPGKSGLELLAQVKQCWPETAVIMLSGIRDAEYAQSLIRMGAIDYIEKPFLLDDVMRSVAQAIDPQDFYSHESSADNSSHKASQGNDEDNTAVFSSVQLGAIFSLAELFEIVQRGRMSGYLELHWGDATIKQAREMGRFNDVAGDLDEAVLHSTGWIYLREGLIIDASIDDTEGSPYWRDAEHSLALLVKLATYIKGVRVWGFSMSEMSRSARLSSGTTAASCSALLRATNRKGMSLRSIVKYQSRS
ncbi:MAG TPA: response regulator [Pyrinomonadaceae bacterium]|jgi:DNA-binding NarL/FixJ family response regulator